MSDVRVQIIRNSRLKLGEAPRVFHSKSLDYLRIKRPMLSFGMSQHLKEIYEEHQYLLVQGHVVWAVLLVANTDLFAKGKNDGRGVVVYCKDIHLHDELLRLADLTEKLEEQRTRNTEEPYENKLYSKVNRNNAWFAPQALPASITDDNSIMISSLLCVRKHFPHNMLIGSFFPILTHPKYKSVALLPDLFWPDDLRASWTTQG